MNRNPNYAKNMTNRIKSSEQARQMGIKSGEVRRAKKNAQMIASHILDLALYEGADIKSVEDVQALAQLKGQNLSVREAVILMQAQAALKGDRDAAVFLINAAGEKPAEKVEVGMSIEDYVKNRKVKL